MPNPQFPVYIPTKGRFDSRLTISTFDDLAVPYKAVVEAQEFDDYARSGVKPENMLVLPHRDKGLVVTRNWIWDHACASGTPYFWTFDDNINGIYRLNNNLKIKVKDGTVLRCAEDFVQRYENVAIAGFHYEFFAWRRAGYPPYILNRRIYSNMLVKTDLKEIDGRPFRNEGFYNDDTDLCLRVMKDKWCTVLFYAFLIKKMPTMMYSGGMTPHYLGEGRLKMAEELAAKHPDVCRIVQKYGRAQHEVDYRSFEKNHPVLKKDAIIPAGINEYGMKIVQSPEYAKK